MLANTNSRLLCIAHSRPGEWEAAALELRTKAKWLHVIRSAVQGCIVACDKQWPGSSCLDLRRVPITWGRVCRCISACKAHNPAHSWNGV